MKVSLLWLGLITIGIILILVGFKGYETYEAFTNTGVKEGFQSGSSSDLQITTCPADSKSYIDNNGRTVCCQGSVENGKCIGNLICTLSEGSKDLPTCSTWYSALLDERGRDRCPTSMRTYFEGGNLGRGCTSGRRNKNGTGPEIPNAKFCKLYTSEKDELLKEDSCTNQKMLEQAVCPVANAKKRLSRWHPNIPPQVYCDFVNPTNGLPINCAEDISTYAQHEYAKKIGILASNWEDNYASSNKINWCRIRKMVDMDKTISFEDLKFVSVNPNANQTTIFRKFKETRPDCCGGGGGFPHDLTCPTGSFVKTIYGTSGSLIDSIGVKCNNGVDLGRRGGRGGSPFSVTSNTGFNKIHVKSGSLVDSIKFFEDNNELRTVGGGGGAGPHDLNCDNGKIMGLKVRTGGLVDRVQVVCGREQ